MFAAPEFVSTVSADLINKSIVSWTSTPGFTNPPTLQCPMIVRKLKSGVEDRFESRPIFPLGSSYELRSGPMRYNRSLVSSLPNLSFAM